MQTAVLVLAVLFATTQVRIKACTFAVSSDAQRVYYERFIIVAEKEVANTEDDPPAWWGVFPDRPPERDAEGRARAVNVPKSKVLKRGEVRMVGGATCKCPDFW